MPTTPAEIDHATIRELHAALGRCLQLAQKESRLWENWDYDALKQLAALHAKHAPQ